MSIVIKMILFEAEVFSIEKGISLQLNKNMSSDFRIWKGSEHRVPFHFEE